MRFPFLVPRPAPLSRCVKALEEIEASHCFSNFGPMNTHFEKEMLAALFNNQGACTTVANATLGLMLAVKQATRDRRSSKYVVMPSFTFAGAANAVDWCGFTPLIADIDPQTWTLAASSVLRLHKEYGNKIAAVFPYATFGNNLDVSWYEEFNAKTKIPVIIDAAASLGSFVRPNQHFGAGSKLVTVFSMHATKAFPTAEGGLIYSTDSQIISDLKAMSNFGFDQKRNAVLPGLNAKLSEFGALLGREKLKTFSETILHRQKIYQTYRQHLKGVEFQKIIGETPAAQMMPILLQNNESREQIIAGLKAQGLETRTYFSPCIHEHPYFSKICEASAIELKHTLEVSKRILNLPIHELLKEQDVLTICEITNHELNKTRLAKAA